MAYNVYFTCERCGATMHWVNHTVTLARAVGIARMQGWQVGKKGWFCPSCRTTKGTPQKEG